MCVYTVYSIYIIYIYIYKIYTYIYKYIYVYIYIYDILINDEIWAFHGRFPGQKPLEMDVPPLEFPENDIDKLVDCLGKTVAPFQHKTAAIKKPRKIYSCNQTNQARVLFTKGV